MKLVKDTEKDLIKKPEVTDKQAEEAFKTILKWIGEDPSREGLLETPKRVVKAFKEYFKGYHQNAEQDLTKTFGDVEGYDDMVVEKNITLESHCEHHMAPIIGVAHVAYIPKDKVIGLSKINRLVDYYAHRPQQQERLSLQIMKDLQNALEIKDVIVMIEAKHLCVSTRGIKDKSSHTTTIEYGGCFEEQSQRQEFLNIISESRI